YTREIPNDHALELSISVAGADSPTKIRFGGTKGAQTDNDRVKCWISVNGLRHTLVVPIPSQLLGKAELSENDELRLHISLRDVREGVSASWRKTCVLSTDRPPDEPSVKKTFRAAENDSQSAGAAR